MKHLFLGMFLLGYIMLSLLTLARSPFPAGDEGWYAQVMDTAARTGRPAHERLLGIAGTDRAYPIFGKLYISLGALALRTGLPDLWVLRFLSLLSLVICLLFSFIWLNSIYENKTALLSVGLLLFSTPLFVASHTVRTECLDLALLSIGLYSAQRSFRSSGKCWALISGLAVGLLPTVHLPATSLVFVVAIWWLLEYRLAFFRQEHFWAWAVGVVIAAAVWFYWQVLSDPDLFFRQLSTVTGMASAPLSWSLNPLHWFKAESRSVWNSYGFSRFGLGIIALSILAIGLIRTAIWRSPRDLKFIGATTGLFLFQSMFSHNRYGWYTVYYLFFLCPLLARAVRICFDDPNERYFCLRWVAITVVTVYMVVATVQIGSKIVLDLQSPSLGTIGKAISAEIPSGARVCASANVYFTKPSFKWVDTWFLQFLPHAGEAEQDRLGHTIEEAFERAGITYIVAHSDHDWELAELDRPDTRDLRSKTRGTAFDMDRFSRLHTKLVKVIEGGRGGDWVIRRVISYH